MCSRSLLPLSRPPNWIFVPCTLSHNHGCKDSGVCSRALPSSRRGNIILNWNLVQLQYICHVIKIVWETFCCDFFEFYRFVIFNENESTVSNSSSSTPFLKRKMHPLTTTLLKKPLQQKLTCGRRPWSSSPWRDGRQRRWPRPTLTGEAARTFLPHGWDPPPQQPWSFLGSSWKEKTRVLQH